MTDLSNAQTIPNLESENNALSHISSGGAHAIDFSADVFIEDTSSIIAIELKSVKPILVKWGEKQKFRR